MRWCTPNQLPAPEPRCPRRNGAQGRWALRTGENKLSDDKRALDQPDRSHQPPHRTGLDTQRTNCADLYRPHPSTRWQPATSAPAGSPPQNAAESPRSSPSANALHIYFDAVIAAVRTRAWSNALIEGINAKIRLINARGYGHHSARKTLKTSHDLPHTWADSTPNSPREREEPHACSSQLPPVADLWKNRQLWITGAAALSARQHRVGTSEQEPACLNHSRGTRRQTRRRTSKRQEPCGFGRSRSLPRWRSCRRLPRCIWAGS